MKVTTTNGKSFTLTRETEADQQLLDALTINVTKLFLAPPLRYEKR